MFTFAIQEAAQLSFTLPSLSEKWNICNLEDKVTVTGKLSSNNETHGVKMFPACFAGCRIRAFSS